jgi:hypothetical protein
MFSPNFAKYVAQIYSTRINGLARTEFLTKLRDRPHLILDSLFRDLIVLVDLYVVNTGETVQVVDNPGEMATYVDSFREHFKSEIAALS